MMDNPLTYIKKVQAEIDGWELLKRIEDSHLGGNVVKSAQYGGTAAGLKIALDMYKGQSWKGE